ncbi:MAG: hypothetical protein R2747_24650 [Pyrinomonadaceae bacterium]
MTALEEKGLTRFEEDFLRSKVVNDRKTADQWLKFFDKIINVESIVADDIARFTGHRTIGLGISAAGFLVIVLGIGLQLAVLLLVGAAAVLIGLIWAAVYHFKKSDISSFRVNSYFVREKILPVIFILREEMADDAPILLNIDLGCFYRRGTLLQHTNFKSDSLSLTDVGVPAGSNTLGFDDGIYKNAWFSGEAGFVDGTELRWDIFDLVKFAEDVIPKRKRYKIKWKSKYKTLVEMEISMPDKIYELPDKAKQKSDEGDYRIKKSGDHYLINIERRFDKTGIYKSDNTYGPFECEDGGKTFEIKNLLDVLGLAYQLARPRKNKK